MPIARLPACALAVLLAITVLPAAAAGWGAVLSRGPVVDFNDEDMRLFLEAIRTTLGADGEPQPVEWSNPASGAGGTLRVVGRPQVAGFKECRRVQATVHSRRQTGKPATWTACKDPAGQWKLVSAS
jgi:surface antigen